MYTIPPPSCASGTLSPYLPTAEQPWTVQHLQHLYRRLGFGASRQEIEVALAQNPADLVDNLINTALTAAPSPVPPWINWTSANYSDDAERLNEDVRSWLMEWVQDMAQHPVRGKLILFWHNHFVTQLETHYFPTYLYQYHQLLQTYALGNFKDFVYEIGKSTPMLLFLNGATNTKYEPNENYARELYELFTLGRDNGYTQQDIEETARALTGWNGFEEWGKPLTFNQRSFDNDSKTIFGKTGNWGYEEVHTILFEERSEQIAQFICRKLYIAYVNPQADESIIQQLAQTFIANDWELVPVLKQLFSSEHFFDEAHYGVQVKNPYELFLTFFKEVDFKTDTKEELDGLLYFTGMLGQELGTPVDVAGWQGNRSWLDTARLSGRWLTMGWKVYQVVDKQPEKLAQLAYQLTGDLNTNDPALVVQKVMDHFLPVSLHTPEIYERATEVFKGEIPQNYFDEGSWNLYWDTVPWQMTLLLQYLIRIPEFQLL